MIGRLMPRTAGYKTHAMKEKSEMTHPTRKRSRRLSQPRMLMLTAVLCMLGSLALAAGAQAAAEEYGIESASASLSTLQAGRHPDVVTEINFNHATEPVPD